jgi:hypothetical protein
MLLSLTLAMTACDKKASAARAALANMNVPFTAASFVENAHQGKTDLVGMFLDAGRIPTPRSMMAGPRWKPPCWRIRWKSSNF